MEAPLYTNQLVYEITLVKDGCIHTYVDTDTGLLRMTLLVDGIFAATCKVDESWPLMTEVQRDYISRLEKDELVEGPRPWITDMAGGGYEANEYLGYAFTMKNVFGNYVEVIIRPDGSKLLVS